MIKLTLIVFITQLVFIWSRTWNVKAIARKDIWQTQLSGAVVHVAWLVSTAIGAVSMWEIMTEFDWAYLPVVIGSLTGGLLGSYISMKSKKF